MLAMLLALSAGRPLLAQKGPLPATAVQTTAGAVLPLNAIQPTAQWLLIYVLPDSPTSERLLSAMREWQLPSFERVVIVVGGDAAKASAFATADHGLPSAQWTIDPERAAWRGLSINGAPTLLGIRAGSIEWRVAGVLNNPEAIRSVIEAWITN
jgi:hypothetical protein